MEAMGVEATTFPPTLQLFSQKKVINSSTKFPKTKSQATHNKHLANFITTQSFPFLKICQLHLIIYKVQQTHRSDKTVGFVFSVSQVLPSGGDLGEACALQPQPIIPYK